MRFARICATVGTAASLTVVGIVASTPALAEEEPVATDGFSVSDYDYVLDPTGTLPLSGTGCGTAASPGTVSAVLGKDQTALGALNSTSVEAAEDGSWKLLNLDIADAAAKADVHDQEKAVVGLYCTTYGNTGNGAFLLDVVLDSTTVDAELMLSDQEDSQVFALSKVSGYKAGETVSFRFVSMENFNKEGGPAAEDFIEAASFTIDENGNYAGPLSFETPDLKDGLYKAIIVGSFYGECSYFSDVSAADGYFTFVNGDDDSDVVPDKLATPDTPKGGEVAATKPPAGTDGGDLAVTGATGLGGAVLAAGMLAAGMVLYRRRSA